MGTYNLDLLIDAAVKQSESQRGKSRQWSASDDAFLRNNLGKLTEAELAKKLGRTVTAVHLRWSRDLQLPAPSKAPGILTAHDVARALGVDAHKTCHWVDVGFIKGRQMAGGRKIRLINREDFEAWALEPMNWMYFDIQAVQDADLKLKLDEAVKAWGDEWWSTPQVAKYHKVTTGDVKRLIQDGRIKATQIMVSYGGRHPNMSWKLWFVRKSEAVRVKFVKRGPRGPMKGKTYLTHKERNNYE